MNWILLAVIGAFSQALGGAIKKKVLQTPGMNTVIGFVSFTMAGLLFGVIMLVAGSTWPDSLSALFWQATFWYVGANIVAVWFLYKALDIAEFSYLMPFMTLTSLSMIIPPMIFLGEVLSWGSFAGIVFIVLGALWMSSAPKKITPSFEDEQRRQDNRRGLWYFLATAACYTVAPTAAKISVQETSVLFASMMVHLLIGLGFLVIALSSREFKKVSAVMRGGELSSLRNGILLAGLVIVIENGSINAALVMAPVASVMAIKRLMPFFAFLIGYFYFKEQTDVRKKILATAMLVVGAIMVTIF